MSDGQSIIGEEGENSEPPGEQGAGGAQGGAQEGGQGGSSDDQWHNGMQGTNHELIDPWVRHQNNNTGSEETYDFLRANGWSKESLGGADNKWCKDCGGGGAGGDDDECEPDPNGGLFWARMCNPKAWLGDITAEPVWEPYLHSEPTAEDPQNGGTKWSDGFWALKNGLVSDGQNNGEERWNYSPKWEIQVTTCHPDTGEDMSILANGTAVYGPTNEPAGHLNEFKYKVGTEMPWDGEGGYDSFYGSCLLVTSCDDKCPAGDPKPWGCTEQSY